MDDFHQSPPRLANQYEDDALLRSYLRWRFGEGGLAGIEPDLERLGSRAATDLLALAAAAEAEPPRHVPYDAWGRRIDDIVVSDAWRALDRVSAEEGIVATAYERAHGALSRVHQMARLYLFHPSSATYSCPLAMGDGAARFLEVHGNVDGEVTRDDAIDAPNGAEDDRAATAILRDAFARLTTRDPGRFWTSGQWMTERAGGSDVSQTATVARATENPRLFQLSGTKWFTSATTSPMAVTLARIEGAPAGSKGLSVFVIVLRDAAGALRGIRVNRLKDKLGTRALPTAELTLDATPAILVGAPGDGVRRIATLFTVTRVYNAVAAVGGMRRALALAYDYAGRRVAFGKPLIEHPLHLETLMELDARWRACFLLAFQVAELLGREECGQATDAELAMLRLLTPVAKLYTARQAVVVASEALELFGGAGYIEDTGLPRLLRDAQVLPIWEGTTNVLSLDVWRAIERAGALAPWLADVRARAHTGERTTAPVLRESALRVHAAAERIEQYVRRVSRSAQSGPGEHEHRESGAAREAGARRLSFAIARTAAAARMVEYATWCADARAADDAPAAAEAAVRWAGRDLAAGL